MTTNNTQSAWPGLLTTAAGEARAAAGAAAVSSAAAALRLAWAASGAVQAEDPAGQLWWLRRAEAVAETADELDLIPGAPGTRLGTGQRPAAALADSAELRAALRELLAAIHTALAGHARRARSGRKKLAAALAAEAAGRAATTAGHDRR
jgi:hypothetical protein